MQKEKIIIGSYVNINGDRTMIDDQLLEKISNEEITEIEPIKIDDGWLNDFGFTQLYGSWRYDHSDSKSVEVIFSKESVIRIQFDLDGVDTYFNQDCQSVHVLQYVCFHRLGKMFSLDNN